MLGEEEVCQQGTVRMADRELLCMVLDGNNRIYGAKNCVDVPEDLDRPRLLCRDSVLD